MLAQRESFAANCVRIWSPSAKDPCWEKNHGGVGTGATQEHAVVVELEAGTKAMMMMMMMMMMTRLRRLLRTLLLSSTTLSVQHLLMALMTSLFVLCEHIHPHTLIHISFILTCSGEPMVVAKPFKFTAEPSNTAKAGKSTATQPPGIGPRLYVDSTNSGGVATSSSGPHGQGLGEGNTSGGDGDGGLCSVGYTAVMSSSLQVTSPYLIIPVQQVHSSNNKYFITPFPNPNPPLTLISLLSL